MVGVRVLLTPALGFELPFITLFPALFFTACVGGFGPSLLATILGASCGLYLFFPPLDSLAMAQPVAQLGVTLFVLTGVIAGALGHSRLGVLNRARKAAE